MATQDIEFDTNPIDYLTANLTTVHTENYLYYYYNHPKYEGIIYVIGDGVTTLGDLRKYTTIGQYTKTASISSGTYILAETTTTAGASGSAIFIVKADSESYILHVSATDSASAKNIGNTTIKILSSGGAASALSFDLAKSDSVGGAGFRLRVTSTASYDIEYQIVGGDSYWSLVAATVTDNDKTPSGDTASFIDAPVIQIYESYGTPATTQVIASTSGNFDTTGAPVLTLTPGIWDMYGTTLLSGTSAADSAFCYLRDVTNSVDYGGGYAYFNTGGDVCPLHVSGRIEVVSGTVEIRIRAMTNGSATSFTFGNLGSGIPSGYLKAIRV